MPVSWIPFSKSLREFVRYAKPTFFSGDLATRQLGNVECLAKSLGTECVAIEDSYVDRDFVDDHSAYYSKSLHQYTGLCQRVHFFKGQIEEVCRAIEATTQDSFGKEIEQYKRLCNKFSSDYYLGFCVVRPLPGSPVGRTVLRPPMVNSSSFFTGVKTYVAHFLGIEMTVRGLAFQQQDLGVSACATTAVWSSVQKMQDFEDIATFTPAAITALASRYSLANGRMMPAESGLSIDQMCQAIQGVGASPCLMVIRNLKEARTYLHAAIMSGFAPILVSEDSRGQMHAVAVTGMELKERGERERLENNEDVWVIGESSRVKSVYLHDDRVGPYVQAELAIGKEEEACFTLCSPNSKEGVIWHIRYIIAPLHAKLRLSFSGLVRVAVEAITVAAGFWLTVIMDLPELKTKFSQDLKYELYFKRIYQYLESLVRGGPNGIVKSLSEDVTFPRYIGIVRLRSEYSDCVDLLIDTTDTYRNVKCLAVVPHSNKSALTDGLVKDLASKYKCWPVTSTREQPTP